MEDSQTTDLNWDNNGNLLTQGTSVYTWDATGRLIGATVEGVESSFAYNGLGRRVARTADGLTTAFVLDVGSELPEVIAATTGESATYYVQIQGQVLAEVDEGTWEYALPDALGSLRQLADASGEVLLAQSFDPFGALLDLLFANAKPIRSRRKKIRQTPLTYQTKFKPKQPYEEEECVDPVSRVSRRLLPTGLCGYHSPLSL